MDLFVNNLAPISKGKLIVKGKCIKNGRTVCLAEALVINEN
jgi:acyl-coenzyme A thioesterase PaaI-like protein